MEQRECIELPFTQLFGVAGSYPLYSFISQQSTVSPRGAPLSQKAGHDILRVYSDVKWQLIPQVPHRIFMYRW